VLTSSSVSYPRAETKRMALCSLAVLYQWDHSELAASTWWRPIQERGFWLIASGAHNPMVDSMSALSNASPVIPEGAPPVKIVLLEEEVDFVLSGDIST